MTSLNTIGQALAAERKSRKLTQQQVAQATGIHKSTLSEIENGHFTGSLDILLRYIHYLNFDLAIQQRQHKLPDWDDLDDLFKDDE